MAILSLEVFSTAEKPCVAPYSITRALYNSYSGSLYQVRRGDNTTKDIALLKPDGYVDASVLANFCRVAGEYRISITYDQSGNENHIAKTPTGSPIYGLHNDSEAVTDALPIWIAGRKTYGVHVTPGGWTTPGWDIETRTLKALLRPITPNPFTW